MSKIGDKYILEITKTGLGSDNSNRLESGDFVTFVAENRIGTLKKYPPWTPVEDGLPTEDGMYNVTLDDGFATSVPWNGSDWELWADSGDVIAWMPMPEEYIPKK